MSTILSEQFELTKKLLDAVINLHPNLQFTSHDKNSLPFLENSIKVQYEGTILCTWYQKPSDTGTVLIYRSCAPHQYKKSIKQGTIHLLFRVTWVAFHEALTKMKKKSKRFQGIELGKLSRI